MPVIDPLTTRTPEGLDLEEASRAKAAASGRHRSPSSPRQDKHQPEIQGLRALAVTLVLLYHLWPSGLTGGYVGVDVFFVISGYLITAHIHREIAATGTLDVPRFWARRIRRLLPISFLVLVVALVGAAVFLPPSTWAVTGRQVNASAFYVENWVLAGDAVEYSAMDDVSTVVQHYWSLSLEEQFYLFWPLLLLGLVYGASRVVRARGRSVPLPPRILMNYALIAIIALSLAYSIRFTASSPSQAYFITPTRIWELAAGALVATAFLGRQFRGPRANLVGWSGIALIAWSALTFSDTTPFPGWHAMLPVIGAVLVLQCGATDGWGGVHHWLSRRPASVIGDLSYGIYLWHWPFIVLTPFIIDAPLRWPQKIGIIVVVVALSTVTKRFVEDPARQSAMLRSLPRSFGFAAAGMALIVGLGIALTPLATSTSQGASLAASDPCYGPGTLAKPERCGSPANDGGFVPTTVAAAKQMKSALIPGCQLSGADWPHTCSTGVDPSKASTTVALVGDSQATRWIPTLQTLAAEQGWHVKIFTRSNCTPSLALALGTDPESTRRGEQCLDAMRKVEQVISKDKSISTVFVAANQTRREFVAPEGTTFANPPVDGITTLLSKWTAAGKDVVVVSESPSRPGRVGSVPICIEEHPDDFLACSSNRKTEAFRDATGSTRFLWSAAKAMTDPKVHRIDLDDRYCDARSCYPVMGGVLVYADIGHITKEWAEALVPVFRSDLAGMGLLTKP